MRLSRLLCGFCYDRIQGDESIEVTALAHDSRAVRRGGVFVCIRGAVADGHRFIKDAVAQGAAAVVIERGWEEKTRGRAAFPAGLTVICTGDTRRALARMAAAYFGNPAEHLRIIGITGTKGKTTTAYMIAAILNTGGYRAGLIGTNEICDGKGCVPSAHTTPEPLTLHRILARMRENGCRFVVMEVSSQALMLGRTDGIIFDTAVFTNLSPDHISPTEHRDFAQYRAAKAKLFTQCRAAVLNGASAYWREMLADADCGFATYAFAPETPEAAPVAGDDAPAAHGRKRAEIAPALCGAEGAPADYQGDNAALLRDTFGVRFSVQGRISGTFSLSMPGRINAENALAAIAVADRYGVPADAMRRALLALRIRGRSELLPVGDGAVVIIDYAHNALSLRRMLETLRAYRPKRVVCVFGCGGGRARARRFRMGKVSGELADLTILTSDNPRDEDPGQILSEIENGICTTGGKYIMIEDRKKAIAFAIGHHRPGDAILIAGKGHETYQEIRGVRYPASDRETAEGAIDVCRYHH